jgi:hypothetical protein
MVTVIIATPIAVANLFDGWVAVRQRQISDTGPHRRLGFPDDGAAGYQYRCGRKRRPQSAHAFLPNSPREHHSFRLSASNRVFCRSVTIRPGIQKQLGPPLATGVSAPYHHIRSGDWPAEFWVACREATECQIDNALVHIDDALVRIEADIGAAL